jgi:secreted PhoX family phosphatase
VGIAVDSSGNVYVVDTFNFRVEKFTSSGSYLMQFGSSSTGPGQLSGPNSVAVDSADNVFVTDAGIRVEEFASSGTFSSMFGSNGTGPGQFTAAYGIATDSSGNVYVVDGQGARVEEFTGSGTFLFQWPCATGGCPTGAGSGQFNVPDGIAIAPSGLVYVTDMSNNQVNEFKVSQTTVTQSLPSMPTSSSTQAGPTQAGPSSIGTLSQTDLLLIGAVIVLVALIAVVMLRRPRPGGRAAGRGVRAEVIYCKKCGTRSSTANQFCEKCGAKLVN